MFPFQVVFVEKLIYEIENFFSNCSCGEGTAKQKFILQVPFVYVARGGQYRVQKYRGTFFSTGTGTVGTWNRLPVPRYFIKN